MMKMRNRTRVLAPSAITAQGMLRVFPLGNASPPPGEAVGMTLAINTGGDKVAAYATINEAYFSESQQNGSIDLTSTMTAMQDRMSRRDGELIGSLRPAAQMMPGPGISTGIGTPMNCSPRLPQHETF